MYFYDGEVHPNKPEGQEFKTEMPGVSVIITAKKGQKHRIGYLDPKFEVCLVIDVGNDRACRYSCYYEIGKYWLSFGTYGYSWLEIREDRCNVKQRIEFRNVDHRGHPCGGCDSASYGNVLVYITKAVGAHSDTVFPVEILIGNDRLYFAYGFEIYNGTETVTFLGMSRDRASINYALFNY